MKQNWYSVLVYLLLALLTLPGSAAQRPTNSWDYWELHNPKSTPSINHGDWQKFLDKRIVKNDSGIHLIDYKNMPKADKVLVYDYIWRLSQIPIRKYNRKEQFAFWVNLYNALTVKLIIEHYPLDSIEDIDISPGLFAHGPWSANIIKVENVSLSLNDIRDRILRPIWNEPRVHYVLHGACISCPNLPNQALTAENTEPVLNAAAHEYVNSLRAIKVINGQLITNKLYEWYQADFGGSQEDVIAHLRYYAEPDLAMQLTDIKKIAETTYNTHLNEVIKPKKE